MGIRKRAINREYTNSDFIRIADEYIHSQRDRDIIKARMVDGLTFDELSDKFSMSDRQIKRIVSKSLDTIFKHMP